MAETDQHSRTEAPTPRRREEARKKGEVAQSKDLTSGLGLLAAVVTLRLFGGVIGGRLMSMVGGQIRAASTASLSVGRLETLARSGLGHLLSICGALMAVTFVVTVLATVFQVGTRVTLEPLQLDGNRMNPMNGLKRLFSSTALMRGVQAILKMTIMLSIVWLSLRSMQGHVAAAPFDSVMHNVQLAWSMSLRMATNVAIALVVVGGADFGFQWWQHETKLRMTRQQVKDEHKQEEVDPMIRARIKRVQREMTKQRMMRDVPTSTVVVTNPTHYAVALQYESDSMTAPKVVAKGVDEVALKIRKIAAEHDVPILERRVLAKALYATVEVGQEIPPSLYHAIAEIVAHLYRLGKFR